MHRRPLLAMLDDYAARHPEQSNVAARIRSLVEQHADCFQRTCRPGHITGGAWVLSHDRRRCLMLHHRKLDRWLQPGGHADGDSDVLAVAVREAEEESGLQGLQPLGGALPFDLDVHLIPARHDAQGALIEDAHEHHDVRFLLAAPDDSPLVVSHESHAVEWCTPDEVRQLTGEESVLRLLRKSLPYLK